MYVTDFVIENHCHNFSGVPGGILTLGCIFSSEDGSLCCIHLQVKRWGLLPTLLLYYNSPLTIDTNIT